MRSREEIIADLEIYSEMTLISIYNKHTRSKPLSHAQYAVMEIQGRIAVLAEAILLVLSEFEDIFNQSSCPETDSINDLGSTLGD